MSLLPLQAQERRLYVEGKVTSSRDSMPVSGVVVRTNEPRAAAQTGPTGRYVLFSVNRPGLVIEFNFLGYLPLRKTLTPELLRTCNGDTLHLDVVLKADLYTLKTFEVKSRPDTVVGSYRYFIEDYLFCGNDTYLLLTFEKSLKAARIQLADGAQHILGSVDVPVEARELYRDYLGNYNVLCTDSAFRIKFLPNNQLMLMALSYAQFTARIFPCIDTIGANILFTNYNRDYPAFSYFLYVPTDTTVFSICSIVDQQLLNQFNWEFDYLKPKERLYARKMEAYLGVDKRLIAATMTGFAQSPQYTPLYAPLFLIRDTIYVFDHYRDHLFRYNRQLLCIDSLPINYHHPKNWREWDRQVIRDEQNGDVYARFEKNGFYTLKKIDLSTGRITGSFKITYPNAKHLRIRNGEVYYIYREYESTQKKTLYKERITLS